MLPLLIGPLISGVLGVIDKAVEDKDQAKIIKAKLNELAVMGEMKELEAAAKIIVAEAQGDSWLQRNWRPLLMVMFGVIIANNYLIVPIFNTPPADIPPDMWDLLKLGVGGYVIGRSAEKGVKAWKQ
jgi:hypothetical protein